MDLHDYIPLIREVHHLDKLSADAYEIVLKYRALRPLIWCISSRTVIQIVQTNNTLPLRIHRLLSPGSRRPTGERIVHRIVLHASPRLILVLERLHHHTPSSAQPTQRSQRRTLERYSLLALSARSRSCRSLPCACACSSALSTCAFVNCGVASTNVTVPSAEMVALMSPSSTCTLPLETVFTHETHDAPC